jgi:precorrin-6B methylase 2
VAVVGGALTVSGLTVRAGAQTTTPPAAPPAPPRTTGQKPFEPYSGQPGKDVVWVPTPQPLVEKMLDMAQVTPQDFVMDLGSGDGRTVITAAKRGATALGIEYNPDMVTLSQQNATKEGVSAKATFRKADLFETDLSKATVITMFLLPSINMKLRPKILDLKPGTRIVTNTFTMEDWQADQQETISGECGGWCTALLWYVPAKVEGTWKVTAGTNSNTLMLRQEFQVLTGSLGSSPISDAKLKGDEIMFTVGASKYTGKVTGNTMSGRITGGGGGSWSATK